MFVFFFHTRINRDVYGYFPKENCPCCNTARVFKVEELTEVKKLWGFIPAGETSLGFVESCNYCEIELTTPVEILKKSSRSWDPSMPLKNLVSETKPSFAIEEPPAKPGSNEIVGFLKSIQIRTKAFARANGGAGGFLGLASGIFSGGFIAAKYFDNSIAVWTTGALLGLIIGIVWEIRQKSLWKASLLLDSLSEKHHLAPREFLEETRKPGSKFGIVESAVKRKAEKTSVSRV